MLDDEEDDENEEDEEEDDDDDDEATEMRQTTLTDGKLTWTSRGSNGKAYEMREEPARKVLIPGDPRSDNPILLDDHFEMVSEFSLWQDGAPVATDSNAEILREFKRLEQL